MLFLKNKTFLETEILFLSINILDTMFILVEYQQINITKINT